MDPGTLQAFYLSVLLVVPTLEGFECPTLYGPYTQQECSSVQEWLVKLGYEKGYCTLLPVPQDGVRRLEVGYLP